MKHRTTVIGPALFAATLLLPQPGSLSGAGWHVLGLAAWMATWWLAGTFPLPVTSLLPIAVLPLAGGGTIREVTASYADPIIFLFFGGFLLAAAMERWNLHRRMALAAVRLVGTNARRVVLAFLVTTGFVSMWISNTAAAVMMFPIATAFSSPARGAGGPAASPGFSKALLLAVAYGASIGGVATLIGTPPNAILAGAARELTGREVDFGRWLMIGFLVSAPLMLACWVLLNRLFGVRGSVAGIEEIAGRRERMQPMPAGEKFVALVFAATALAWVLRAPKHFGAFTLWGITDILPDVSDAGIAITAALLLFAWPLPRTSEWKTALDWKTAMTIPWGVLLLFGGGLALAVAFKTSGLTDWLAFLLSGLEGVSLGVVVPATAVMFVFLTELTSNTATAALSMPLMVSVGQALGVDPYPLMVTAALSASMAFMLPVATPPNAVVFGSGLIRQSDMARAGIFLNVLSIIVISLVVLLFVR